MSAGYIAAAGALAVFLAVLAAVVIRERRSSPPEEAVNGGKWFLSGLHEKVFDLLTGKDPAEAARLLGIDVNKINSSCRVLAIKPDFKRMSVALIRGIFSMLGSLCAGSLAVAAAALLKGRKDRLKPALRVSRDEYLRASDDNSFVFSPFLLAGFVFTQTVLYLITQAGLPEWM